VALAFCKSACETPSARENPVTTPPTVETLTCAAASPPDRLAVPMCLRTGTQPRVDRDARALPFERLQMPLFEEAFETAFRIACHASRSRRVRRVPPIRGLASKNRAYHPHDQTRVVSGGQSFGRRTMAERVAQSRSRAAGSCAPRGSPRRPRRPRCPACNSSCCRRISTSIRKPRGIRTIPGNAYRRIVRHRLAGLAASAGIRRGALNDEIGLGQRNLRRTAVSKKLEAAISLMMASRAEAPFGAGSDP